MTVEWLRMCSTATAFASGCLERELLIWDRWKKVVRQGISSARVRDLYTAVDFVPTVEYGYECRPSGCRCRSRRLQSKDHGEDHDFSSVQCARLQRCRGFRD